MSFSISGLHFCIIIQRDRYRPEGFSPRVDIGREMITVLKWKKACIILCIAYFKIGTKSTKLISHRDTKHIWIRVIDISWGMITVLLWTKSCIDLFIERLDIVLSDFYPDICPWADIAMALPVATYRQHLRYYVYIWDKNNLYSNNDIMCDVLYLKIFLVN